MRRQVPAPGGGGGGGGGVPVKGESGGNVLNSFGATQGLGLELRII